MGASRGMMVLFVKQVHLQKEVGAASEKGGKVLAGRLYAEEEWIRGRGTYRLRKLGRGGRIGIGGGRWGAWCLVCWVGGMGETW